MVKISVILTAFNEEKYIKKAIESILNQTLTDLELIVVNDGSTDNTLDIINSFDDDRLKLINHENMGPGASRNKALTLAEGEYVMYLDGDDWYREDAMEIAYMEAMDKDSDFTFYQMINYDDKTGEIYENDWFNLNIFDESFENTVFNMNDFKGSIFDLSVGVCQKIYNISFLKRIDAKFPEGILFEDMPFFYYVLLKAEKISIVKKQLYYRRKHEESITNVVDGKFLDTIPAGQTLMRIFTENEWYDTYKFDLLAYKINGPRFALRDIKENYKIPLYELIKKDYDSIKQSQYYQDYLDNLGPVKKKFFLDIIESEDYDDFLSLNSE
ncbi:glycosyltransferase family 2 protein [uncultured Methanobrevibacter sp.]|uniref:glycosyltransferase family 2 protein n=1 Tax=uncultured Methanobrevibacter sp. TaxID=253161 RepID=UPI0025EF3515|nr:glycosyltransferase family 2 protein [uncultured Methanobrevibacter sp.]